MARADPRRAGMPVSRAGRAGQGQQGARKHATMASPCGACSSMDRIGVSEASDTGSIPVGRAIVVDEVAVRLL